jgi:serine/threonine protein kinase
VDEYGIKKSLRKKLDKHYFIKKLLGKGSYGCVSLGVSKETGKSVALKVMKSQTNNEYEIIKTIREVKLLRSLNDIYHNARKNMDEREEGEKSTINIGDDKYSNPFFPGLIDVVCPVKRSKVKVKSAYSMGLDTSPLTNGKDKTSSTTPNIEDIDRYDLSQICIVMEHVDTDLDQLLKNKINFSEHHLKKVIYNSLCSLAFMHMLNVMHRDIKPANILLTSDCKVKICDLGLSRCMPKGK